MNRQWKISKQHFLLTKLYIKLSRIILSPFCSVVGELTHLPYCRIYASVNWISIGSDNGLSPDRRQAIIWNNAAILLIAPLGTNSNDIRIKIQNSSFMKVHLKGSSAKRRPFCQRGVGVGGWGWGVWGVGGWVGGGGGGGGWVNSLRPSDAYMRQ